MVFESMQSGTYELIRILDDVSLNTDLSTLYGIVEKSILNKKLNIVFSFTSGSFLYTHHIAVLIKCLELIRDADGTLSVVNPSKDIDDVLMLIDPESLIRRFGSEAELVSNNTKTSS